MFNYQFNGEKDAMNQCSGILVYQSALVYSNNKLTLRRIASATPITDLDSARYQLLVQASQTQFLSDLKSLLAQKNSAGKPVFDQKAILLQDTLKQS